MTEMRRTDYQYDTHASLTNTNAFRCVTCYFGIFTGHLNLQLSVAISKNSTANNI